MTAPDLLPCPFCGGKAVAFSYITEGAVRCGGCHAAITRGHIHTSETGYDEAIAAWNTRATTVALSPIAGRTLDEWTEFARRDDCLEGMVPSDLRQLLAALRGIGDGRT